MKTSLQTRVSVLITLIILSISVICHVSFHLSAHRSKEREFRGADPRCPIAFSKAAEEGLLEKNRNLIKKVRHYPGAGRLADTGLFEQLGSG